MTRPRRRADKSHLALLALLAAAAACSSQRYFVPAEKSLTATAEGPVAAQYEVRVGEKRWGDVRVWSNGAATREVDGQKRTVVHVAIETRNAIDAPLGVDLAHTRMEAIDVGARATDSLSPRVTTGDPVTQAHSVGVLGFEFVLPEGISPSELQSFRIHWWLHGPDEQVYEQFTQFVYRPSYEYGPPGPYYYGPYYPWPYYRRWWGGWGGWGFYWCGGGDPLPPSGEPALLEVVLVPAQVMPDLVQQGDPQLLA